MFCVQQLVIVTLVCFLDFEIFDSSYRKKIVQFLDGQHHRKTIAMLKVPTKDDEYSIDWRKKIYCIYIQKILIQTNR